MAETVTWGVKVPEELKEKISEMQQQTGLVGKDFVDALIQAYEINQIKETKPIMKADIEELQAITGRIVDIYSSLGVRVENLTKEKDEQFKTTIQGKDSTIELYYNKMKSLELELESLKGEKSGIEIINADFVKRTAQLEESINVNKALVQEYKEKNDTLTGLLKKYESYVTENEILKQEIDKEHVAFKAAKEAYANDIQEKNNIISDNIKEIESLKNKLSDLKEKNENEKSQLEEKFKNGIERATEKATLEIEKAALEKEKAILELKALHQDEINKLNTQYNEKIRSYIFALEKPGVQEKKDKKSNNNSIE